MFKQLQQIRKNLANLLYARNDLSLGNQFLRYGNKSIKSDWSDIIMSDRDLYSGYGYAAIRNRSNATARIALENVKTDDEGGVVHPYLEIISSSPTFSDYQFWHDISVYLDLEGVYYLMAIRAIGQNAVGNVQEFKMLNPYNIKRVMSKDRLTVEGYIETKKGLIREIPKDMIIEIRDLNPFDDENPYSMTDAAKDPQYTLKTAGDYTRHALKGNINAPGILSTDVILPTQDFENFVSRVRNHSKGEPLFSNGSGGITYQNMTQDLKGSALDVVEKMNRDQLFAIAGVSKTVMGIEESGTTRETSRTQKDLMIESQILPRIQLIIDALNQDYLNHYKNQKLIRIIVNNPLGTDYDAKLKENELKGKDLELYNSLILQGYDSKIATAYVMGEIQIDGLGEPTKKPTESNDKKESVDKKIVNQFEDDKQGLITQQQGALQNAIVNVESKITSGIIDRVRKLMSKTSINEPEDITIEEKDIITKTEKKEYSSELLAIMTAFYGIVMTLEGGQKMRDRTGELGLKGDFSLNKDIQKYIKKTATKVSSGHVDTVAEDLYELVRADALKGLSQDEIISNIKKKYNTDIIESRAKTVARTETNRAFTRSQYEADKQFVKQNKLEGRVYKQWVTRGPNPCPLCQELASRGKIPFGTVFANEGDNIRVDGKDYPIGFENLESGNAHPNCNCTYQLIVETQNNELERKLLQKELELKNKEKELQTFIEELL